MTLTPPAPRQQSNRNGVIHRKSVDAGALLVALWFAVATDET
jgi:hypothetical protein